jgi:hypothetical protein
VDNRTFLSWLVLQMCSCNLAQASFVARLADEYLDGILACRALSRPFVDACLSKMSEVQIMMTTVIVSANRYTDSKFFRQGNPPFGREFLESILTSMYISWSVSVDLRTALACLSRHPRCLHLSEDVDCACDAPTRDFEW